MIELGVVAESIDKKHILIGECKWTDGEDARRLVNSLKEKIKNLSFVKEGQEIHLVLFLKQKPTHEDTVRYFIPDDILSV